MQPKSYLAALAALSAVAAIGSAHAADAMQNDALAIAAARIDLARAVQAAEQHAGGKAARAEFERHAGKWLFDVEVVKGKSVMDVQVDASSGKVVAVNADAIDADDAGDRPD